MAEFWWPPAPTSEAPRDPRQPHTALRDLHTQLISSAYLYDDPQAFASGVHSALVAVTPLITELVQRAGSPEEAGGP